MKRILGLTLVLTLALGVTFAYACGEKKASAEAMKANVETSNSGSAAYSASNTGVSAAAVEVMPAVAVEKTDVKANACASKARAMKANAGSCGSKAKVMKADAKAEFCPVSADCPQPCIKEGGEVKTMKAAAPSVDLQTAGASACASKAKAMKADAKMSAECAAKCAAAKAQRASAETGGSCHDADVQESVEKIESKDVETAKAKSDGMVSSTANLTPESGSMK